MKERFFHVHFGLPMRTTGLVAGMLLTLLAPLPSIAQSEAEEMFTPRYLALLPWYCRYAASYRERMPGGNDPVQTERWKSIVGDIHNHMHHYCSGLSWRDRATLFARTEAERMKSLQASVGEFTYVIDRSRPDNPLLPEFFTMRGKSLIALNRPSLAIADLVRAIEIKPDYWPPYVELGDYYKNSGDFTKAREWFKQGLSAVPDSKTLKTRLAKLEEAKGEEKAAAAATEKPPVKKASEATRSSKGPQKQ